MRSEEVRTQDMSSLGAGTPAYFPLDTSIASCPAPARRRFWMNGGVRWREHGGGPGSCPCSGASELGGYRGVAFSPGVPFLSQLYEEDSFGVTSWE